MKKIIFALFALLLLSNVFALDRITGNAIEDVEADYEKVNQNVGQLNENADQVPGFIKKIFGNERINVQITTTDGQLFEFYVVTKEGTLQEMKNGKLEDYTMTVTTTEDAINKIKESEDPLTALNNALDNKEINYTAKKTTTKIKTGIGRAFLKIRGWFT